MKWYISNLKTIKSLKKLTLIAFSALFSQFPDHFLVYDIFVDKIVQSSHDNLTVIVNIGHFLIDFVSIVASVRQTNFISFN